MSGSRFIMVALLPLVLGGCSWFGGSRSRTQQLGAESFYRPLPGAEDRRELNTDRSGAIRDPYIASSAPPRIALGPNRTPTAVARTPATAPAAVDSVTLPPASPQSATSLPSVAPAYSTGQYQTVGAVVVEVSGTPIYADKVVHTLTPALAAEAKLRSAEDFRGFATTQIGQAVKNLVQSELYYAAAIRRLSSEDKDRANSITMYWKSQRITEAGGSVELARKKAEADGVNFDEMVADHYRNVILSLYQYKKITPKVPVTAEEMRRYYLDHLKKDFTSVDEAQFRVIQITASKMPGEDAAHRKAAALAKIKEIRDAVVDRGDPEFAKAASEKNDNPVLMKNGGRVGDENGWMQRGSYAVPLVEEEVWKLQPGQITDVIQVGDSFYIARLTDRKLGQARTFEEVQDQIADAIRRPQLAAFQAKMIDELTKEAVIYPENPKDWRMQPVLEMIMQMYPQWAIQRK